MKSENSEPGVLIKSKKRKGDIIISSKIGVRHIYEKIAENIPGFVYQFVLNNDGTMFFPFISSGLKRLFGVSPDMLERNASLALQKVHLDDIIALKESIIESSKNMSLWNHTFRIICPNPNITWVQGFATPEQGLNGQTIWHGLLYDVTEKKASEEILLKQQQQLDEIAFIQAHEFRRPVANMLGIFDIINFESNNQNFDQNQMTHWLKLMKKSVKETDDIIAKIITKATEKKAM